MAAQLGQIRDLIRFRRFVVISQKYGLALTKQIIPRQGFHLSGVSTTFYTQPIFLKVTWKGFYVETQTGRLVDYRHFDFMLVSDSDIRGGNTNGH